MADKEKKVDNITFTDEEVNTLKQISANYVNLQQVFGQIEVQMLLLQNQMEDLEVSKEKTTQEYKDNQENEKKLMAELEKKYGEGNYDPKTNTFTPNS
jgi:chromosome segregation ATPase|tara:strand:- start:6375 stop:6668 length:294 start_codon:yes stop_codon:yes gene_type:complete